MSVSPKLYEAIKTASTCADRLRDAVREGRYREARRRAEALCLMVDRIHWIARKEKLDARERRHRRQALPAHDVPA